MDIEYKTYEFDGIIIGGGGAGLMAAIRAQENGARVAVIMKCILGKAHTVMAEGGMAAAIAKEDTTEKHFVDTMIGGYGINDWKSVWKLVNGGKEALFYLETKGAVFDRNDNGNVEPRAFGGHSEKRTFHVSDRTGHAIIHTLKNELLRCEIPFFEKTMITNLLVKENVVCGAAGIDIRTGEFVLFKVKFVILATGGCGGLYKYTSNSKDLTADGISLAYECGAELRDMEMVQIHPTCMVDPEEKRGILITEACRGEGGILINAKGERFMKTAKNQDGTPKYLGKLGHCELETRDVVARAIEEQYEKALGPVKLIVCKNAWENETRRMRISNEFQSLVDKEKLLDGEGVLNRLSTTYEQFIKFANIDITKEGMVVRPAQHYMMGGLNVNAENHMTNVPGIFAAGEVSGGVHGANRLGGNSLTDIQVEGAEAGKEAANYAKKTKFLEPLKNEVIGEFMRLLSLLGEGGIRQGEIREELKLIMWKYAGIRRDGEELNFALMELEKLRVKASGIKVTGKRVANTAWQEAIETLSMLSVAEAILKSAFARHESRGAHYRKDFPKTDKRLLVNIICRKGENDEMIIEEREVERMPQHLRSLFPKDWLSKVY